MTDFSRERAYPHVVSVGTDTPHRCYSQRDILELFRVSDPKIRSIFDNSHINNRYLYLPDVDDQGNMPTESSLALANKHREKALAIGSSAILRALQPLGLSVRDVDYFACVTSTGFLCPSLTAHFIAEMGFRQDVHRIDVVGMGCNGGLNALQPVVTYCAMDEGTIGLELCVEVCSAAYVIDGTLNTAVVNSLFGDGAAAAVVAAPSPRPHCRTPRILGFSSHIIPAAIGAMRFDFDGARFAFHLDKQVPYVIGEHVHVPVNALLARFGIKRRDISHWVIHSGGRKVIDSIKYSLGLSDHDVRHTHGVLQDFGNLSSGSFLFSLDRLMRDDDIAKGDFVLLMTMGPGSTIECCLGTF